MVKPRSMLAHTLNPAKGWPSPHAVDFRAKISSAVLFTLFSGRAVHIDANGEYRTGVDPAAASTGMTLFTFPNGDDPDVVNDGGDPATDADAWVPVGPTGQMLALPAKGAYELETTEFIAGVYPPGTPLTAPNDDADVAVGGILTTGTAYTDHICGVVSRGLVPSGYGPRGGSGGQALAFWPVWLPPTP